MQRNKSGSSGNGWQQPDCTNCYGCDSRPDWRIADMVSDLKECIGEVDRHLMMNCNFKGKKVRRLHWKTCKAYTTQDFDRLISVFREYRPEGVKKLETAGFEKWSRAYCLANRYNYMTSNSVESVNSLCRIVQKLPVTRLIEYFRDLLQRWYCDKRHKYEDAPADELTPWAAAKVKYRMLKSTNWKVNGIDSMRMYQVIKNQALHQVNFINFSSTCRKWQLSGLPCGHVCVVSRHCDLSNCNLWAQAWFMKTTLKATYQELVYPLKDVSMWEAQNDLQQVLLDYGSWMRTHTTRSV
ncbi:hypothetical protein Tco_1515512 [Tanacetum coccineum]